jgi:hypothetical protein
VPRWDKRSFAIALKTDIPLLPKAASFPKVVPSAIDILRMLALGLDAFSIVTGVVGTLAVLIPLYRWLLPRQRIKDLDAVVCNVECLVDTLREAGALEPMLATPTSECLLRSVEWTSTTIVN